MIYFKSLNAKIAIWDCHLKKNNSGFSSIFNLSCVCRNISNCQNLISNSFSLESISDLKADQLFLF